MHANWTTPVTCSCPEHLAYQWPVIRQFIDTSAREQTIHLLSTITFSWTSKTDGLGNEASCDVGGNTDTSTVRAESSDEITGDKDDNDDCSVMLSVGCTDWRRWICLLTSDFRCFVKNSTQSPPCAYTTCSSTTLKWTIKMSNELHASNCK